MPTVTRFSASPWDAFDNAYLEFLTDTDGSLHVRSLDDTPVDFGNATAVGYKVRCGIVARQDDTYTLRIRVRTTTGTILAAADSGGSFQTVAVNPTTPWVYFPGASTFTGFTYVNTAATKADWDTNAVVEMEQGYSRSMGADGTAIRVDGVELQITYDAGAPPPLTFEVATCSVLAQDLSFTGGFTPHGSDIPHTYIEGGHRLGPFCDANGNLYIFLEVNEATGQPFMLKSTDGGDTWAEVDQAGRPAQTDMEGADIRQVGETLHIGVQGPGSDDVRYFTFRTSDHPTNADTWGVNELVQSAPDPLEQTACLEVRSDGSVVIGYGRLVGQTTGHVCYKIRSPGGVWGAEVIIESANQTNHFYQITSAMDANELIHFLYGASNGTLRHRTLSTGDVLGGEQTITSNIGASSGNDRCPILPPRHFVDAGNQVVAVAYKRLSDDFICMRTITNAGVPSAEVVVSDHAAAHNVLGINSRMPVATMVRDDSTGEFHVLYANGGASPNAADATRTVYHKFTDGGVWQPAEVFINGGIDSHAMRCEIFTHSAGNSGARVVGLYWDTGSAGLEGSRYDELFLGAGAPPGTPLDFIAASSPILAQDLSLAPDAAGLVPTPAVSPILAHDLILSPAAVGLDFEPAALPVFAQDISLTPSAPAVNLQPAASSLVANDISMAAGAAALEFIAAATGVDAQDASLAAGAVGLVLGPAVQAGQAQSLTLGAAGAPLNLGAAPSPLQAHDITLTPGVAPLTFQVASLLGVGIPLLMGGETPMPFEAAATSAQGADLDLTSTLEMLFEVANVLTDSPGITMTPASVSALLAAAQMSLSAQDLSLQGGAPSVDFQVASVVVVPAPPTFAPGPAPIAFVSASMTMQARDLVLSSGPQAIQFEGLPILIVAQDLNLTPGPAVALFSSAAVASQGQDLSLQPEPVGLVFTVAGITPIARNFLLALGELGRPGRGVRVASARATPRAILRAAVVARALVHSTGTTLEES